MCVCVCVSVCLRADGFFCGSDSTKAVIRSVPFQLSFILKGSFPSCFLLIISKLKASQTGCGRKRRCLATLRSTCLSRQRQVKVRVKVRVLMSIDFPFFLLSTVRMETSWRLDQLAAASSSGTCPRGSWRHTWLETTGETVTSNKHHVHLLALHWSQGAQQANRQELMLTAAS